MALFAPYCGGRSREQDLLRVLAYWSGGGVRGVRSLMEASPHRFDLRWQPVRAPLESTACTLNIEAEPPLAYRFSVPAHQLMVWLMESGDRSDRLELPDRFWQWLLLEAGAEDL
jgi:hypothetical protein